MDEELKELFINHSGKISDKWTLYINEWDKIFSPFREHEINLLEIGVHNGGSLEIWAKYFQNAKHIVGCDIDEACRKLVYHDFRISVIIGDAKTDDVELSISELVPDLDIIIDDGSHKSGDIIRSFSRYFKKLNKSGLYIIEDLHSSYWNEFEGGLYNPYSAISFFKRLVDITNFEHWRNNQTREKFLLPYKQCYGVDFGEFDLNMIHSIKFINSLCIVLKGSPEENNLGNRVIVGSEELVSQDIQKLNGITIHDIATDTKDDSNSDIFSLMNQVEILKADAEKRERTNQQLNADVAEIGQANQQLKMDAEERERDIQQLKAEITEQEQAIQQLKVDVAEREQEVYSLNLNLFENEKIIHNQNKIIAEEEKEILSYVLSKSWRFIRTLPKLPKIFSGKGMLKNLYHYLIIARRGLFDHAYYLRSYPDVRKAKVDPLMHFIRYGWKEGRNPNGKFNTKSYLDLHPDVENSGLNPLIHYCSHDKKADSITAANNLENTLCDDFDLPSKELFSYRIELNSNNPPKTSDIIIFPIIDWEFRFQRPQQLACQLADLGHRIFYIKTTFCNKKAPIIKVIKNNIYSVQLSGSDSSLDIYSSLLGEDLDDLESSIRLLRDQFLINSAIMMVDLPIWRKLATRLKETYGWKLLYDCMDLHTGFSGNSPFVDQEEQFLLRESDIVLATSHFLYDRVKNTNNHTILVPNGTDFTFFHQALKQVDIDDIKNLPQPIIGYYGAIADWFDTYLVGELASDHPEWSFLLIGSTFLADLKPLQNLANVHLPGEINYSELPAYLSNFDVCIIPFKKISLTHATNPVKMYEYFSAGKPVVSTRLNEISNYEEYVKLAETKEEWEIAIQESLVENKTPELLSKRYEFAKANAWEMRAKKIETEVLRLYPRISIIVVTYNNLDYTKLCLESIIKNTGYPNYEIIVVDNASKKDTVEYIKAFGSKHQNVKLKLNDENLGFARANNRGFRESRGEYIVFLNNDTIVTPGWLHRLLQYLHQNPSTGMVGPVTNSIGNEAKIDVSYNNLADINTYAAYRAKDYSGRAFKIEVLALYCCMISRELFESVGCLDERYRIGMFEDDDLAMKIKQKGLNLICAEDVFIYHFHGASLRKLSAEKYERIFTENKRRYEDKWGIKWNPHQYRR